MADVPSDAPAGDRAFFGHPRGLAYLAFTEAWERFSFYGMQTLLMLYMVGQLLQPGHVETVVGFARLRSGIEAVTGPLTTVGLGSMVFGLYSSFAYFLPVFGGWVGDRLLGQYRCVLLGAVLMALGHFLMAFEPSFLLALLLLIVGAGFLKGNINTQVGRLYGPEDRRRVDAYQIFTIGINVGVVSAPFVCGTLGELYGWHYGFGAAGIGMLIGLIIYVAGRRHLPPDRLTAATPKADRPRLMPGDGKAIAALLVALVVITLYLASVGQAGSIYLLWVREHVERTVLGLTLPVTWLLSATAFISILLPALLLRLWQWQARRGREPSLLAKIGIGCAIGALACLVLVVLALIIEAGGRVAWPWLLIHHLIVAVAYLFIWPVGMALFSRAAPAAVNATFIGVFFMSAFLANNLVGWLGGFYEKMAPSQFWLLHAGLGAAGAAIVLVLHRPLARALALKDAPAS
jgi:proton-dependent oligopeptide transporter, POT family